MVAASIEMPISEGSSAMRRVAIGMLFAVLLFRAVEFAATGFAAIHYPWGPEYGEGIVWQQMRWIFTEKAYGPIDQFPAIVFHYTPLYHAVASQISSTLGTDELATGRAISLVSTLVAALASGAIAAMLVAGRRRKQDRWLAGCAASLLVLTFVPVMAPPLMRVDMLAIALSLLGLIAALKSIERPGLMLVASLLFVAAVYTKQTAIAAPIAAFAVLLATRPKLAIQGIATCTALGVAALIVLNWLTDGGFYQHVLLYNVNRVEPSRLVWIIYAAATHAIYVALTVWMVARRVGDLRTRYRTFGALRTAACGDIRLLIALAYLAVTTVMLLTVVKSGSSINYFIEWCFATAIFCAIGLQEQPPATVGSIKARSVIAVSIPLGLLLQATITSGEAFDMDINGRRARELTVLSRQVAAADKPVISDDMVLLIRSGREVLWEPAIFAELASTGAWDERQFVDRIRNGEFAFFVTAGRRGDEHFDERYNPAVADAIDAAYPVKQEIAGLTVHRPLNRGRADRASEAAAH